MACVTCSTSFAEIQVTIPLGAANPNTPFSLSPSAISIQVNETVTWKNNDNSIHTVTTGNPGVGFDGRIDSGVITQGGSFSHTFDKIGVYNYYCLFHPWMTGFVSVGTSTSAMPTGISISTDKSTYHNGDTIQISGKVSKFVQNKQVIVWITDSKGTGVSVSRIETRTGSDFSANVIASGKLWVPGNNYTVYAQYGSSSSIATSVIQYEPQAQNLTNENNASNTNTVVLTPTWYMSSYQKQNPDSDKYITVQAEHKIYKPSDQVKVFGSIWNGLFNVVGGAYLVTVPVSNTDGNSITELVLIKIKDEHGSVLNTKEMQLDRNGNYDVQFDLPSSAHGKYFVDTILETKTGLLGTLDASIVAKLYSSTSFIVATPDEFLVSTKEGNFTVGISSNSTVSNFSFDSQGKIISFIVQGETGTSGISYIVVPKSLLGGQIQVLIDGNIQPYNSDGVVVLSDTSSETGFEINYYHSIHTIQLVGTSAAQMPTVIQAVPEFTSLVSLMLVFSIVLVIILSTKTRVFSDKF
jgi:plastocyanin